MGQDHASKYNYLFFVQILLIIPRGKKAIILMQDTAPSCSSKFTKEYLATRYLKEDQDHGLASKFCRPQSNCEPLEHRDTEGFLGWKAVFIQRKPIAGHF